MLAVDTVVCPALSTPCLRLLIQSYALPPLFECVRRMVPRDVLRRCCERFRLPRRMPCRSWLCLRDCAVHPGLPVCAGAGGGSSVLRVSAPSGIMRDLDFGFVGPLCAAIVCRCAGGVRLLAAAPRVRSPSAPTDALYLPGLDDARTPQQMTGYPAQLQVCWLSSSH